jgi:tRNA threonylcarbamoyladenosine biosynthesis protein TsaB
MITALSSSCANDKVGYIETNEIIRLKKQIKFFNIISLKIVYLRYVLFQQEDYNRKIIKLLNKLLWQVHLNIMTYILAIDATLGACSTALLKNGEVLNQMKEVRVRGHVERLIPMIDETCKAVGVSQSQFDYIAVTIGPGTFAGVRIGLSAAKGMALALGIPLIPLTTLESIAHQYAVDHQELSETFAVAIDARRGEIYFQKFKMNKGDINSVAEAMAVPLSQINIDGIDIIVGSGAELIKDIVGNETFRVDDNYQYPEATVMGKLATSKIEQAKFSDDVSPLYLRAPDAIKPKALNMVITDD